jgi:glycosyltransferase involved in cell wall biosynthesis
MVSTFYPPDNFGGDGMHIYRLSNELAKRGHEVDVFYCRDAFLSLTKNTPTGAFPNHENVRVYGLKSSARILSPLLTQQLGVPAFKGEIKSALENNDYDVIHYHNMSLIGISALAYGSALKLYTTHEHWLICPMHVLWKYNREICLEKNCFSCQLKGKRPPQLWRKLKFFRRMLSQIDCFLSPSRFTLRKHLEAGLDLPFRHLPYFLPGVKNKPQIEKNNVQSRPYFLFVGRLEEIKGAQNLIRVFKKLPEFDLLIAGDGAYKERLAELAQDFPNIKFLGRLGQESLDEFYRSARAVVVPSICYETFGIIIIEAFARKTPVIVSNLGALPEVVEDSSGGLVYQTDEELINAVRLLAGNENLRRKLGERGYEAFIKYWNEEAHLTKYLDLIEELQTAREKNNFAVSEFSRQITPAEITARL